MTPVIDIVPAAMSHAAMRTSSLRVTAIAVPPEHLRSPRGWRDPELPLSRLPRRRAIFPLVVGELLHVAAVVAHHEQLAVGLRRVRVDHFVLESHPRAGEHDVFAV